MNTTTTPPSGHLAAGGTLPNGATLVAHTLLNTAGGTGEGVAIVLGIWNGQYVTWNMDVATGECYWGRYFSAWDFHSAYADLVKRGGAPQ